MRFHWQNLNEKKYSKGSPLKAGRAWFHFGKACLSVEWGWQWGRLMLECGVDDHYDRLGPGLGLRLLGPYLFIGFTHPWLSKRFRRESQTGFSVNFSELKCIQLWFRADRMNGEGWSKFIDLPDLLWGRAKHSKTELGKFPVVIPLPEGPYTGMATIVRARWNRPRWPFAAERISAWVKLDSGLPKPGKGENSWDCGDDAVMSYGCESTDYADIVAKGVQLCMRDRVRYSACHWTPTPDRTATEGCNMPIEA